jgi:hypothetical protein
MNKYRNRKITVDGEVFDSQKEYKRWRELVLLVKAGQISDLSRQVKIELIPSQRVGGKVAERACHYVADFVYIDKDGQMVVEDTKGFRTADYIIKRKLMLWAHGIQIKEV